jgi:hypothetical protein
MIVAWNPATFLNGSTSVGGTDRAVYAQFTDTGPVILTLGVFRIRFPVTRFFTPMSILPRIARE